MHTRGTRVLACVCSLLVWVPLVAAQGAVKPPAASSQSSKPAKPAQPRPQAARAAAAFDDLAAKATTAREESRLEEAIALYQKALQQKPDWVEGQWYLGTAYYELDRYPEARDAFRRVTVLDPQNAAAWVLKGHCEFQLKSYETSLADFLRARVLGMGANRELAGVGRYHTALLLTRREEYEQALQILNEFAQEGNDSPSIVEAMGIAALRIPVLPSELPGVRREQVMLAGRASYFMAARLSAAAQKAFEELIARYPESPNVHYAYGVFLTAEQPDAAIEQFHKELEISPRHPWVKMQLAFEYIRRGEWEAARPWAEQAVEEAPNVFLARRALGQVLLETGDLEGAIAEFEMGVKMEPKSPAMRFALARAYRRAGRTGEAEKQQAEFARLDRIQRRVRSGPQSVGGIEIDTVDDAELPQ